MDGPPTGGTRAGRRISPLAGPPPRQVPPPPGAVSRSLPPVGSGPIIRAPRRPPTPPPSGTGALPPSPPGRPIGPPRGTPTPPPRPPGAIRPPDTPRAPAKPVPKAPDKPPNALDTPANATAARLLAEGRARGAATGGRRNRRERRRFDPASLASLPEVLHEWYQGHRHRRRTRLAAYTPSQKRWYWARMAGLGAIGMFFVLPLTMFVFGYLCFSIPTTDDAVNKQIATIDYADGSELARIVPAEGNRVKVGIDQIPKPVQYAVLSAEDRSFFSNPGFDPMGLFRAVWKQLNGSAGGGSTITQQFVKKTLVGDEHSLWRKYKEMIIAVKISQQSSKGDILASYLNAIYFGRGAYGIEAASRAYFGKDVWDLNPSQGGLLASVIQSPSRWDPAVNPQHAVERWNFVMNGMVQQGWMTPEQRAQAEFPATIPPRRVSGGIPGDSRGLILSAIRDELGRQGISEQQFSQDGLKISTTIDPQTQRQAVDAVHETLSDQPTNLRSALVAVDPQSGGILAYYGGDNGVGLDYARVSKQPGSTFKPFVLLAALRQEDPIGLGTQFNGMPLANLRNADGASCQLCDLKQAMTISNNVIYHELAGRVGPSKVVDAARDLGITSPMKNADDSIALGNKEVTPVELASAYATLAAKGVYRRPHLVTKVTTSDDRVIYESVDADQTRIDPKVARNVVEAMLGVPTYDKLTIGRPVAAKTGTVQSRIEGQNNDAWTAGFTPNLVSVVWIGTDQNSPIKTARGNPISGATLPGSIWKSFMAEATKSMSVESFGTFKAIGTPPAVTGPYDGLNALSPQSSAPSDAAESSESSSSTGSSTSSAPPSNSSSADSGTGAAPGADDSRRSRSSRSRDSDDTDSREPVRGG